VLTRELNLKRSQLAELSANYTEKHPNVVRLRGEVEELEKKLAAIPMSQGFSKDDGKKVSNSRTSLPLTERGAEEYRSLKAQILSTEAQMNTMKRERESIRRSIFALQAKVDQSPRRDQELIALNRDYENIKTQYNELLKKKSEANISQDLEMRQKGDQYQILDPANLPAKPFKPNVRKIFVLAFIMATALGFGGAIGFEKMDLSLRGATDFKHYFDLPILASIPILETMEFHRRKNLRRYAIVGGVISFAFAVVVFLLLVSVKSK
jgi:uncharacterized protein involved in exopolysaccharide biosynthesis